MKIQLTPKEDIELSKSNITKVVGILSEKEFTETNNAVLNILKSTVHELSKLAISIEELDYVSLHTRNLFELYLILNHIYSDNNAMVNWYGQMHKDSEQVRNGFRKLLVKKGVDTTSLDEVALFENHALEISSYKSERNFNIKNLAIKHGYEDDYDFVYKLSSKLVHPSSMKVNLYDILTENDKYLSTLVLIAMHFGQKTEKLALRIQKELA